MNGAEQRVRVLEASVTVLQTESRAAGPAVTERLSQLALSMEQQCCPGSGDQGMSNIE